MLLHEKLNIGFGDDSLCEKSGTTWTCYVYLGGRLEAKLVGTGKYYYISDALGSTRQVWKHGATSPTFTVATYKPFGTPVSPMGTEKFEYAGEMIVSAAGSSPGLYYVGARWMDPELGRWYSLDPELGKLSMPQSMNRYVYCVNNPLRFTDPTGEGWWSEHWKTLAVVAVCIAAVALTAVTLGTAAPLATLAASMAISAISGAATSTAIYHVTTPASERSLTGYIGAAVSGGISGAAIGAAPFTGGASAAFAVGATGGLGGYIAGQTIKGDRITVGGLLLSGFLGGAAGAGSRALGQGLSKWYESATKSKQRAPLVPGYRNWEKVLAEQDWTKVAGGIAISGVWSSSWAIAKGIARESGPFEWWPLGALRLTEIRTYSG